MFRRLITASVVSLALAVSTGTAALAATAAPAAAAGAPAVSAVQATAPSSAPTFYCAPGLVGTVCNLVLGPICRNRCMAAGSADAAALATRGSVASSRLAAAPAGAPSAANASTPTMMCAPGFEILCYVLGLTICHKWSCGLATNASVATSATPQPKIACSINLLCTILGLVCPHCTIAVPNSAAMAEPDAARR
jgi:hypothetical protein